MFGNSCMYYFISLIKMLYWMVSKTKSPLTRSQLIHAIQRNFDGLDEFNATEIFLTHINSKISNKQTSASTENKQTVIPIEDRQATDAPNENVQTGTSQPSKEKVLNT